jgi:hypothetical protein
LTAALHWRTLRDVRMQLSGGISMTKSMLLLIGLFFAVPLGVAGAQTGGINNQGNQAVPGNQGRIQSISPARSPCGAGSQSVRVCGNDFQSCNSACFATAVADAASSEGCRQRCCNNFRTCLSIRGCGNLTSNDCTSPINPAVRALRGVGVQ